MKKQRVITILILLLSVSINLALAQDYRPLGVEAEIEEAKEKRRAEKAGDDVLYMPSVFGAVKVKFETSLYDGNNRFSVRNSRIGLKGNASRSMKYQVQIDFHNDGKISVLDAFVSYARGGFEISLGQQAYHFSHELTRGPNANIFANRSFMAKFLTSYYGTSSSGAAYVKNWGARDLGAVAHYKLSCIPLKLTVGAFSGNGVNNAQWRNTVNAVARIEYGRGMGFGAAVSHYNGYTPLGTISYISGGQPHQSSSYTQRIRMWGAETSYKNKNFWIQGEYAQRRLQERLSDDEGVNIASVGHIQSYYQFRMRPSSELSFIAPVLRWDVGHKLDYLNTAGAKDTFTANRITVGITLGFIQKIIGSEVRVNYEKFMVNNNSPELKRNKMLQDKITIELVAVF